MNGFEAVFSNGDRIEAPSYTGILVGALTVMDDAAERGLERPTVTVVENSNERTRCLFAGIDRRYVHRLVYGAG